jgi:2-polyprenyl-6-methoxyphenol hydroxylase-like FAD-dependent oxidoreductase
MDPAGAGPHEAKSRWRAPCVVSDVMTAAHVTPVKIEQTQILVVGGGPVGLFAGLCAARRGLDVTLLEQNFRGYARGHATLLHPSSLRLLSEFGISPQLLAEGRPVDSVHVYVDGNSALQLELPHPALTIPQTVFEEILLKALRAEGAEFRSPCEATLISQTAERVQVRAVRRELVSAGSPAQAGEWEPVESSTFEAPFVIGADGYDSRVRTALGIETASAGATETFAMFEGPQTKVAATFELSFASGLGSVALPLANHRSRWGFQLAKDFNLTPDIGRLRALMSERTPWQRDLPAEVEWGTVTHFERRLARRFGRGRVWLAGDAAHITSPFGGQSMNGGLTEVHELVGQMCTCLSGATSVEALEQQGLAREREWHKLLGFNVQIDTLPNAPSWLAEHARRIVPALPASGQDLRSLLKQLGLMIR